MFPQRMLIIFLLLVSWGGGVAIAGLGRTGGMAPDAPPSAVNRPPAEFFRPPGDPAAPALENPSEEPLLVILYKFKDTGYPFAMTDAQHWEGLAFTANRSLASYFDEVSYGLLQITPAAESHGVLGDGVAGWYTSTKNFSEYASAQGTDVMEILQDALSAANADVDFASFDANADGAIAASELHIMVVAALHEASYEERYDDGSGYREIWRQNRCFSAARVHDGVSVGECAKGGSAFVIGEVDPFGRRIGLGLAAHMLGNQLGWPDLYDTDGNCNNGWVRNQGLGIWDLMAAGDWLGDYDGDNDSLLAMTPAHPSAWCKAARRWLTPTEVTADVDNVVIRDVETTKAAFKLWTDGAYGGANKEYFLVESRLRSGFDAALPAEGLLVYHVDEGVARLDYTPGYGGDNWADNTLQWDAEREYIDVECACGFHRNADGSACGLGCPGCSRDDLDVWVSSDHTDPLAEPDCAHGVDYANLGDAGNPFPGAMNKSAIDSTTCPSTGGNNGVNTGVAVRNVHKSGGQYVADLAVELPAPPVPDVWLMDCEDDDGSEPSCYTNCPSWWRSPDIYIDNDDDGALDYPREGKECTFYVKVRNRGATRAVSVDVSLYYRSNSGGLSFPTGATQIGNTQTVYNIKAGDSTRASFTFTIPSPPDDGGHWCFGATLDCTADAVNADTGPANDNNIACVNIGVLASRAQEGLDVDVLRSVFLAETPEDDTNPGPGLYRIEMFPDIGEASTASLEYRPTPESPWIAYPGQWANGSFYGDDFRLEGTPEHDIPFRINVAPDPQAAHGALGEVVVRQVCRGPDHAKSGGRGVSGVGEKGASPEEAAQEPPAGLPMGGERCAGAVVIPAMPYTDWGWTNEALNDYFEDCSDYPERDLAPDLVYVVSPAQDMLVTIDLCGSQFDTKLIVYQDECQEPNDGREPYACNDDACGPQGLQSRIEGLPLYAGNDYYIVVDGWDASAGEYYLIVTGEPYDVPAMGGMIYPVWVDAYGPSRIADLSARPSNNQPPGGEQQLGIRLAWSPSRTDTNGNPEWMQCYHLVRSERAGFDPDTCSWQRVVSIDTDHNTPGWQFDDRGTEEAPIEPGTTYYYRIRAEDFAGWKSEWSNEAGAAALPLLDHADHDAGALVLTVTDQGIVGFMDEAHSAGTGLVYPRGGENLLYVGSLWAGTSGTYVANRDYDPDPSREWTVAGDPDGRIWIEEDPSGGKQTIHAGFTDAGAAQPVGLHVRQDSEAHAAATDDRFVIVTYEIENRSESPIPSLYAGLFLDLDFDDYTQNHGGVIADQNAAWIGDGGSRYAGAMILKSAPVGNVSLIENPTFVWPNHYVLDSDKYDFLSAAPGYVLTDGQAANDYGLVVSVGPLSLGPRSSGPGSTTTIAFAVVVGASLAELRGNCIRAAQLYHPEWTGVDTEPSAVTRTRLLSPSPNPFAASTRILFDLAQPEEVRVVVHDVAGRRVRLLHDGMLPQGRHCLTWRGDSDETRRVASGPYFLTFRAGRNVATQRILLIR